MGGLLCSDHAQPRTKFPTVLPWLADAAGVRGTLARSERATGQRALAIWGLRTLARCFGRRKHIQSHDDSTSRWLNIGENVTCRKSRCLRQQALAVEDRKRSLPGQEAHAADRRLSILSHGTTNDQGFEAILWRRKGFGFAGAWTVCEQNRLLALCFGLPEINKVFSIRPVGVKRVQT